MIVRVAACDEGVEAFQPMNQTHTDKLVERPVDLQRRPQPVVAQHVENAVGAQRPVRRRQRLEDQRLIAGQAAGRGRLVVMMSTQGRLPLANGSRSSRRYAIR